MSEAILVNLYIERLLKEIGELTKSKLLVEAQLDFTEKLNKDLRQQLDKYQKAEEKPVNGNGKKKKDVTEVPKMEEGTVL